MFDHFFSRKSHFPTQPLLAGIFADVPRWRVRHTRGATIHKGGGGSWTKICSGSFWDSQLRTKSGKTKQKSVLSWGGFAISFLDHRVLFYKLILLCFI